MDIQHLRCFVAVAEELHFGRASERLHLTPSPVSRKIKELERELGVDLFVRRYHSVSLTPAGIALIDDARDLLRDFARLRRTVQKLDLGDITRVCRIGFTHVAHPLILDAAIEVISSVDRNVECEVTVGTTSELLPALEEQELDLAIVHVPVGSPDLGTLYVADYSFSVAMRAGHPLAEREVLKMDDLVGYTLITQPSRMQPRAWKALREQTESLGVTSFHEVTTTDPSHTASYVRHSDELSLTPTFATAVYEDPAFKIVPLDDERHRWGAAVAWRRNVLEVDPTLEEIVAALNERFSDGPLRF